MNTQQVRQNQYCKNWREVLEELQFDIQSNIRKFVLWEQRNQQRGKNKYLNEWDFPRSVVKCDKCRENIGNKTIKKTYNLKKYITIHRSFIYGDRNKNLDTIYKTYCFSCVRDYPVLTQCLYTEYNRFY